MNESDRNIDAALQAPDRLTCEVCFTSSFEPCPEAECGLAHPHPDLAHACCQYCRLVEAYVALKEAASNRTPLVRALVAAIQRPLHLPSHDCGYDHECIDEAARALVAAWPEVGG